MLLALLAWPVQGAEDLSTWTEEDPYSVLTVTDTAITVAQVTTAQQAYVTKDFGADYWGDFEVTMEFTGGQCSHTINTNVLGVWGLSNITDGTTWTGIFFGQGIAIRWSRDANGHLLILEAHNYPDHVYELSDPLSISTKYYITITCDADGGTNSEGLYTLIICTGNYYGEGGASEVDTVTLDVPVGWGQSWQYAHTAFTRTNGNSSVTQSGLIENISIDGYVPDEPEEAPGQATGPSPAHQATGVTITPTLTWAAADGATDYIVNFGQGSLSEIGNQTTRSYAPAELDPNTSYMWRIDANNVEGETAGDVWTFTTAYAYGEPNYGETEDFNYWTLVNPQSELAVTDANTITATTLSMDHSAYAYRLLGANYFSGDYSIRWQADVNEATNNGTLGLLALTDTVGSYMDFVWGVRDVQGVYVKNESGVLNCHLAIWDDGAIDTNSVTLVVGTRYFFQLERDDDAGDNSTGLLTLYISTTAYHGEDGAVDVNSVLMDVPAGEQLDFDYAVTAYTKGNHGASSTVSGTVEYLDLGAEVEPNYDPPAKTTIITPADGATGVSTGATLGWNASANATNYDVYFGTPGDLTLMANQTTRSYTPSGMVDANEYAWRIDPNNTYGLTQGDEWTFTTGTTTSTTGSLSSVTQHGITWTFDKAYTVGEFANGDFYVVGPVTVTGISPSGATQNGSMINPVVNTAQGFDSRSNMWNASTNVATSLPLTIATGSSLISSRSLSSASSASYVGYCAILTVLASAPADGSFRPAYFGTDKTIPGNTSQLNYGLLYALTPTASAPTPMAAAEWFEGPWIDFGYGANGRTFHPAGQMPPYGRDLSARMGSGALALHLNYTDEQKETLMIRFTQLGIDNYGIVSHTGGRTTWEPDGGHCMGRKFPILFAGAVLGNSSMSAVGEKSGVYAYSAKTGGGFYGAGSLPPDYLYFQEDMQTFHVSQADVDRVLATEITGHPISATSTTLVINGLPRWWGQPHDRYVIITAGTGAGQMRYVSSSTYNRSGYPEDPVTLTISEAWTTTPTSSSTFKLEGYRVADLGLAEWGVRHATLPVQDNPSWGADYRHTASIAYPGFTLAAMIMGLEPQWNHEAMFGWVDRWMDTSGEAWEAFHVEMWAAYRDNLPDPIITPPSVPSSPTPADAATDVSPTVTLRWEGVASTWTVFMGTSPDALVFESETTIRQHQPTDLDYATTYYWQIAAENQYGASLSPVWSFTTAAEVIQAPGTPVLQSPANGATNQATDVTLRWGSTAQTTRYDLWVGTTSLEFVASTTGLSYSLTDLADSTTYQWRIDAVGPGGLTSSVTRTFTTAAAGITPDDPSPPDLPAASPGIRVRGPRAIQGRPDWATARYSNSYESLHVVELIKEPGEPGTYVVDPYLTGYLERVVIVAEGDDTQWSVRITDRAGGLMFEALDLDMTAGPVSYDGQRVPFDGGLKIEVNNTTGADRFEIYAYVWEVFTR
jgi:hypothetical protein